MKNILLIGIGGTGSEAVDVLFKKIHELGQQNDNVINAIVLDTDTGDMSQIKEASVISMSDNASVGTITDSIGKEYIKGWFPCDDPTVRTQEMIKGASQWRKKSYLAFLNAMNKPRSRSQFETALERMTIDPNASCEVYIIASIAGGTGSGSFIPIALYVRRYLRKQLGKNPMIYAMIALPDIFAGQQTKDNKIKVYANAYAILRELNAINLVARDYNSGRTARKQSPIKFKIGHENEPNVGLLFDASNKQFWTPEAAPFNQIFLLDRIPGVKSIKAHNIVLANSLYTLLCTEIGNKFDSEVSNHELLRSQNNGSNAIYAGISTSQINFPVESILDYLAHEKTVSSCEKEWLILHRETEKKIQEREENEKDSGRRYVMKDADYANFFIESYDKIDGNDNQEMIISIINEDTTKFSEDGKNKLNIVDEYINKIKGYISSKVPNVSNNIFEKGLDKSQLKELDADEIHAKAEEFYGAILEYYKACIASIRSTSKGLSESILSFNPETFALADKKYSLLENILKNDDKFIHPVSAVYQLCRLKLALQSVIKSVENIKLWPEVKRGEVKNVYSELLKVNAEDGNPKSAYFKAGAERFINLIDESVYEEGKKYKFALDYEQLCVDAEEIIKSINDKASEQINKLIFERLNKDVTLLLDKYRVFFNRFEKEKADLTEETKTAKRKDCGIIDSVINVYSSEKEKDAILESIFKANGPMTQDEMNESNNIVGSGVFNTVYESACAVRNDKQWNDKDSSSYRSLFGKMVEAYKNSIAKSEAYEELAGSSVIEAIVKSAGNNPQFSELEEKFGHYLSLAQELATPSLKISSNYADDLVDPSNIIVFMMSYETAKYIKKNADLLKLPLPADQSSEHSIIASCAEEFVRRYAANDNVRVSIVKNMPSKVLYCTGEIMDITPLRIEKFDELSEDNLYYSNYVSALRRFKEYNTEMWNPHLGDNLHKRGYLPYMNPRMEKECDRKMVKALLYALGSGQIKYQKGFSKSGTYTFRYVKDGVREQIKAPDGQIITEKSIAKLMAWIRNEEELIQKWSEAYDQSIEKQCQDLPILNGDNEMAALEAKVTQTSFMRQLTGASGSTKEQGGLFTLKDDDRLSIIEFAYKIKNNEESGLDCDDAERIIEVAYETFMKLVTYRTPMKAFPERFIQLYKHEVSNLYKGIANSAIKLCEGSAFGNSEDAIENAFNQILFWLNYADTFRGIGAESECIDEMGEILINQNVTTKHELCKGANERIKEAVAELKKAKKEAKEKEAAAAAEEE